MMEIVAQVLFAVVCGSTGHVFLWAVTGGRWRPFDGRDDMATLIGIVVWGAVGVGVYLTFFRPAA
jgi:hypothetical protein